MNTTICYLVIALLLIETGLAQSLPNNLEFQHWEDNTNYGKIYHVAQAHPNASDANPGTKTAPFKTISRAAELLKPGEKVIIHSGTYRECIQPKIGGRDAQGMIAYEAAKGEEVIISGAIPIEGKWETSVLAGKQDVSTNLAN